MKKLKRILQRLQTYTYKFARIPAHPFYCPVCDLPVRQWKPLIRLVGENKYRNEQEGRLCPHCGSFERTRHFWLWLNQEGFVKKDLRFLHFAPEPFLEARLKQLYGSKYVSTDLDMPNVTINADITKLPFENQSFDFIYCSNVLEHVPDDKAAMSELHRVLATGGTAVIQVPIKGEVTDEDLTVTDPEQRAVRFGQADHVRYYGKDIINKLRATGFTVEEGEMLDRLRLTPGEIEKMRLNKREPVHFCRR